MTSVTILVVEDNEPFRRLICSSLQRWPDFQVVGETSDGLEAVTKAKELQPDVVLLDLGLPKLSGLQAARRMRELAPHSRILVVSQESSVDVLRDALEVGASGYVLKSRVHSDLLIGIDTLLAGARFVGHGLDFVEILEPQARCRHELLLCPDEEAHLESFTRSIGGAFEAGHAALLLIAESRRERAFQRLAARGVDIDAAIERGTCIAWDADQPLSRLRLPEALTRLRGAASRADNADPRVVIWGERAGRVWAAGETNEAIELERLSNALIASHAVDILCPYPARDGEDRAALRDICAEHIAVHSR